MLPKRYKTVLQELLDVQQAFNDSPTLDQKAIYWRNVVLAGFSEDFSDLGFDLRFKLSDFGELENWRLVPQKGVLYYG